MTTASIVERVCNCCNPLRDDSLGDLDKLADPDVLALEIIEIVEAGLANFKEIAEGLNGNSK